MRKLILALFLIGIGQVFAKKYPTSDHYDGKKFFNPGPAETRSFLDVIKWKMTSDAAEWPNFVENRNYPAPILAPNNKALVTFINHATFLIQFQGLTILTDPIFSERASPVTFAGPKRVRAPGISIENLPPVDAIVISHNHYDHLDLKSLEMLDDKFHPLFLVPLGDKELLKSKGLQNVVELDWWEKKEIKEVTITFTPALHWSSRTPFDRNESLWGGYFIENSSFKIFFAGDTGYSDHFKKVKAKLGSPHIALLPIGAYEPRWFMKASHMNPEEAVIAHTDLGAEKSFGMHFGTFQLTDEGIEDPVLDLKKAKEKMQNVSNSFEVLDHGESRQY